VQPRVRRHPGPPEERAGRCEHRVDRNRGRRV